MKGKIIFRHVLQSFLIILLAGTLQVLPVHAATAQNPIMWADVPDVSVIRVGSNYYMSSTTMHMNPGVPIMKSTNLVNWEIVNYVYPTLGNGDKENLNNGQNEYGKGSWASSLRYKNGIYYVAFMSYTSNNTYVFQTANIETGPWTRYALGAAYHDCSLLFDDDGRVYLTYGAGDIKVVELTSDAKAVKSGGLQKTLITNAGSIAGSGGLAAEGSHAFKINGKYYIFLISWPSGGSRTELVYRADSFSGAYQGQVLLRSGIAQGGVVDTPDGKWYAMLFQDSGAVGRIPSLIPVTWSGNWPVLGSTTDTGIPVSAGSRFTACDGFDSGTGPGLMWQWNHNPDNNYWSYNSARPGYFRITNGSVRADILSAKNTLTQRTSGGESSAIVAMETGGMKDGDYAGLTAFQFYYGFVGVRMSGTSKSIVMVRGSTNDVSQASSPVEIASLPVNQNRVYLKVYTDFRNRTDKAYFYYSLDGIAWTSIGSTLQMAYTLPHFMGYRFGLFTYATKSAGGYVDFDYFTLNPAPAGGCAIGTPVNTPTSTPCVLTAITPYIQVNGGAWQQTNAVSVISLPATVNLGPQPVTGGSWSWSGPNGFNSTSREIDSIALSAGTNVYTAAYTNNCGLKSTQVFTISVQGSTPTFTDTNTPVPTANTPTYTFTKTNTPIPPTATPTATPVIASVWRVNAGGPAYTDVSGNVWIADANYNSGTSDTQAAGTPVAGTTDATLYQSERFGSPFTYAFNVPAGSYQVTLKFAELYSGHTGAGQRVFNLSINGTQMITNLDIYSEVGADKSDDKVFNNIQPSGGQITIQFGPASADNAQVCAIQIIPQSATPTATPTTPVPTDTPITPSPIPTTPVPTDTPITPSPTPTTPVPTDTPITPSPTPTTPVPTDTPITPSPTPTTPVPTDTPITPSPTPTTPVPTNTPITPTATPTTPVPTNTQVISTATPTNTPNVKLTLKLKSADTNNNTSSPHPVIQVINSGTSAISLNNIEARYWINCDCTGQAIQAFVDYAGKMPQGTSLGSNVQITAVSSARGSQTGYLSIKFSGSITLQPNEYVEVQARFNKSDWSAMTQSNDWSFSNSQTTQVFQQITGYSNGSLVWGQEPPVTTNTVAVANVITYPNPATAATGATLQYTVNQVSGGVSAAGLNEPIYVPDLSTKVYLKIFSIAGRLIWEQALEGVYYVATGVHSVRWDGKAAGGHELSPGSYIFKVLLKELNGSSTGYSTIIMLK